MWGGGGRLFFFFFLILDNLFCYVFETNLRFIYHIPENLGTSRTLTTSGIVLLVTLFNGFWLGLISGRFLSWILWGSCWRRL